MSRIDSGCAEQLISHSDSVLRPAYRSFVALCKDLRLAEDEQNELEAHLYTMRLRCRLAKQRQT